MRKLTFESEVDYKIWAALNKATVKLKHPDWKPEQVNSVMASSERILKDIGMLEKKY